MDEEYGSSQDSGQVRTNDRSRQEVTANLNFSLFAPRRSWVL
jgi:hypothetical protein